MRVRVIGDSHAACLRTAWRALESDYPDMQLDFAAATGDLLWHVAVEGSCLVPTDAVLANTLQGICQISRIETAGYDAICLVGLGFSLANVDVSLYADYRTIAQSQTEAKYLVSDACFAAAFVGTLRQSLAMYLAEMVGSITSAPIFLVPQPMPSETILAGPRWRTMHETGDHLTLSRQFHAACIDLSGEKHTFIPQPTDTFATPATTRREYSIGSRRFGDALHDEDEFLHMNEAYGAVALRSVLAAIAKGAVPASR
jgi:hypothetical protein